MPPRRAKSPPSITRACYRQVPACNQQRCLDGGARRSRADVLVLVQVYRRSLHQHSTETERAKREPVSEAPTQCAPFPGFLRWLEPSRPAVGRTPTTQELPVCSQLEDRQSPEPVLTPITHSYSRLVFRRGSLARTRGLQVFTSYQMSHTRRPKRSRLRHV